MKHDIIICHLSFNHSPFDDRIYWKELNSLKRKGYQVVHITVGESNNDFISREGIRIITIKKRKFFKNVWLNRAIQLVFYRKSTINQLLTLAKKLSAQIYHYHDFQLNAIVGHLKSLPHSPKVIYDAHEAYNLLFQENAPANPLARLLYKIYTALAIRWERKMASKCDFIITTDNYTLNYFEHYLPYIPKTNIFNYSFFSPRDRIAKPKQYHFIYTGLMTESRGIIESIRAFNILVGEYEEVRMLFIGSFENEIFRQKVNNLICKLNLKENVILKAQVPFSGISSFYEVSLIGLGLFHNTPKYSTFIPIKLFEYMAFGLPVIFSEHGPSATIITKASCGILVDYKNEVQIYQAMKNLLGNKDLYSTLSYNAKKAIQHEYNWQKEEQKLFRVYEDLLQKPY